MPLTPSSDGVFPTIPEDDGSGGSGNESQEKQHPLERNTSSMCAISDSTNTHKKVSLERISSVNKTAGRERKTSYRTQGSVEGRTIGTRPQNISRSSSIESNAASSPPAHPRLERRRSGSVRQDITSHAAEGVQQYDSYVIKGERTRDQSLTSNYISGGALGLEGRGIDMGFNTLIEEGYSPSSYILPTKETQAEKQKLTTHDVTDTKESFQSRDFWDAFDEDEVDDDVFADHKIFWSPRDLVLTSLQITAAALLLLFATITLASIQISLIVLTRPSRDTQVQLFSQLAVLAASCVPTILSMPALCLNMLKKKLRWPNFQQAVVAVVASLLDVYNLIILSTCLLPKLDVLEALLVLAATSSTSQSLKLLISSCKEAGDSPTVFNSSTLASIIQISTAVCLLINSYNEGDHTAAALIPMTIIVSIICETLKTASVAHTANSERSKRAVEFIASSAKVCFTVILGHIFMDFTSVYDLSAAPSYGIVAVTLLICAPVVLYTLLRVINYFKLCKGSSTALLSSLPLTVIVGIIVAITYSQEMCLLAYEEECQTPLKLIRGVRVNWSLLMVLASWVWSYRVLTFASESGAAGFGAFMIYKAENFALGYLTASMVIHKEKTHNLSSSNFLPLYDKNSSFARPAEDYLTEDIKPKVYMCATMWHETGEEMTQLLTSVMKLDEYQCMKRQATDLLTHTELDISDPEYFEFETHIMFDDAMSWGDNGERNLNSFVSEFTKIVQEVAIKLHGFECMGEAPQMYPTPYGGRLVYTLPGDNSLVVHLKDKLKIRNKKRWSMIQYMYYLLGYKLLSEYPEDYMKLRYQKMPCKTRVCADSTFLLTVDGDTDFEPSSIQKMLNQIRANDEVGVVCGRIHPIGPGWLVWYQRFEYAVAHWLHKTAEHVMGVVLCTPGAFSMFRASALMDNNIIKTFTKEVESGRDALQYEQGEDRWLCSLLFQQGHRCEYVPGASAMTFAPETLHEFFNQRRRWALSTVVNHLDLLVKWRNSYLKNRDISLVYVFFEAMLFLTTILGPAYVLLVLAYANFLVFGMDLHMSYYVAIAPPLLYAVVCCFTSMNTQIRLAHTLSMFYGSIMASYLFWNFFTVVEYNKLSALGMLMFLLGCLFALTAVLHPREITDILPITLYYLLIPTTYMILMIYCVFNLDNVSWGTREVAATKRKEKTDDSIVRDDLVNPSWTESEAVKDYQMEYLDENEIIFWKRLIGRYLSPHHHSEETKASLESDLQKLKRKSIVAYMGLNGFVLYLFYLMQKYAHILIPGNEEEGTVEPVAVMCVVMFGLLVLAQFICLIWQRVVHITKGCATRLNLRHSSVEELHPDLQTAKKVVEHLKKLKLAGTGLKRVTSDKSMSAQLSSKIDRLSDLISTSADYDDKPGNNRRNNKSSHKQTNAVGSKLAKM